MVVVISGGSSGIGRQTAHYFAERGHTVYELSRTGSDADMVRHCTCDVSDEAAVQKAVAGIGALEGQIDLVVANAGFGISGPFVGTPDRQMTDQYEVNVFGAARLVNAAFPYLSKAAQNAPGKARVLFVSSVAADIAIPFQAHYSATKAALKSFALALDNEWRPLGIRALALLPGDTKTGFTDARVKVTGDPRADRSVARMETDETKGGEAFAVARRIYRLLAEKKNPKVVSTLGAKYAAALVLFKWLPLRLANYLVGTLYSA